MSIWRRWWFRIAMGLVVAVAGLMIRMYWQRHEAAEELRQALAELDEAEPNWRLEQIEAKRRIVPDEQNGAIVILAAHGNLPKDWHRVVAKLQEQLSNTPPPVQFADDLSQQLSTELKAVENVVLGSRKLFDYPRGRFAIKYTPDWFSTNLEDQQKSREVANVLVLDSYRSVQESQSDQSWRAARAIFYIGRAFEDEPLLISQLIRMALQSLAIQSLERTLAHGPITEAELAAMQGIVAEEAAENLFLIAMRGERAGMHQLFEFVEQGSVPIATAIGDFSRGKKRQPELWDYVSDLWARKMAYRSHAWLVRHHTQVIAAAPKPGLARHVALAEIDLAVKETFAARDYDMIMARLLASAFRKVAEAEHRIDTHLHCTIAALAAERYRLQRKRWPESLDELVQAKLLKEPPEDLYTGQPIRLRRADDGVVFHSVGKEGNYQGDALDRLDEFNPNQIRVEFRLWNTDKRRQPPLPPRKVDEDP